MTALVRYRLALLLRSGHWLPPTLFYAAVVLIGSQGSSGVGEALGYSAAILVPGVAWMTRAALTAEPEAARHCVAAAVGPRRTHLAALASGLIAGLVLAACGVGVMLISVGKTKPESALTAGLVTAAICLLTGSAVGAVCNPPIIARAAFAIPIAGIVAIGVLVAGGSPVNAAITGITPSDTQARMPVGPAVIVLVVTIACWAVSAYTASRKEFHVSDESD
jgi:hypothetical protein